MRRFMISKDLPPNLGNRPTDLMILEAVQEIMTERLRKAAADNLNVEHQHQTASVITGAGNRARLTATTYIVEEHDIHHLHALVKAVTSDDDTAILKAARDFAEYLNALRDPETDAQPSITS